MVHTQFKLRYKTTLWLYILVQSRVEIKKSWWIWFFIVSDFRAYAVNANHFGYYVSGRTQSRIKSAMQYAADIGKRKPQKKKNKQTCFKETISWWWTWRWEKTSTTLCTKGYRVSSCFFQGDSLLKPDYTYHPSGPSGLKSWTWEVIDGKPTQEHQRKVGPKRGLANDANPSTISPLSKIHVVS